MGVWLHFPYAGGHIYSDLVYIFQNRICVIPDSGQSGLHPLYGNAPASCILTVPYLQSFMEYPVVTGTFIYANAVLGSLFPGSILNNYYLFNSFFLFFPSLLVVRELLLLVELRGVSRNRVLWYFIVTPTFLYLTMLNWYIIGVWLSLFGIRKYLTGSRVGAGLVFGLSAATNFVTAVPALGFFIASKGVKERVLFAGSGLAVYGALNAPILVLNPKNWFAAFTYIYKWNIEDSWMQAVLPSLDSPARHYIFYAVLALVVAIMLWLRSKGSITDPLAFAFIGMFGYVFATYICTPQLNLMLLPFFVLLPVSSIYLEFLAFDITNSLIIIIGFSEALQPFGITYPLHIPIDRTNIVWWIEVVRSLWEGRFTFFSGVWRIWPIGAQTEALAADLKAPSSPGLTD